MGSCSLPCSMPCSPRGGCSGLPALLIFLAFFPIILPLIKIALCMFFQVVVPAVVVSFVITSIYDVAPHSAPMRAGCCFKKTTQSPPHETNEKKETVREVLARDATKVNDDEDDEQQKDIKMVLAAPGVRPSDIKVAIIDRDIKIQGETKKDEGLFVIERTIHVPRIADVDTLQVTSADGMLTLTMRPKVSKRVPIHVEVSSGHEGQPSTSSTSKKSDDHESTEPKSSDEWEPLAKEE